MNVNFVSLIQSLVDSSPVLCKSVQITLPLGPSLSAPDCLLGFVDFCDLDFSLAVFLALLWFANSLCISLVFWLNASCFSLLFVDILSCVFSEFLVSTLLCAPLDISPNPDREFIPPNTLSTALTALPSLPTTFPWKSVI